MAFVRRYFQQKPSRGDLQDVSAIIRKPESQAMSKGLSGAQRAMLEKATLNPDGARIRGPGKHRNARILEERGLAKLLVFTNGLTSRILITPAGRAALASRLKED